MRMPHVVAVLKVPSPVAVVDVTIRMGSVIAKPRTILHAHCRAISVIDLAMKVRVIDGFAIRPATRRPPVATFSVEADPNITRIRRGSQRLVLFSRVNRRELVAPFNAVIVRLTPRHRAVEYVIDLRMVATRARCTPAGGRGIPCAVAGCVRRHERTFASDVSKAASVSARIVRLAHKVRFARPPRARVVLGTPRRVAVSAPSDGIVRGGARRGTRCRRCDCLCTARHAACFGRPVASMGSPCHARPRRCTESSAACTGSSTGSAAAPGRDATPRCRLRGATPVSVAGAGSCLACAGAPMASRGYRGVTTLLCNYFPGLMTPGPVSRRAD